MPEPDKKPDNDRNVLLCNPTWAGQAAVPSKIMNCEICGQEVWVSPASLIAAGANTRIVCTSCIQAVIDEMPPGELRLDPPTEGQILEIKRSLNPE